tara:strand:+ start:13916 stop:14065 length:150 start_codon:yes stop_codon:yes gene_type:complete
VTATHGFLFRGLMQSKRLEIAKICFVCQLSELAGEEAKPFRLFLSLAES